MTRKPTTAIAAMLLAMTLTMTLGACFRSDEPAPVDNHTGPAAEATTQATEAAPEAPVASPAPAATADVNMTAEAPPPEVAPAPDEQMMDDASATGMTARSSRAEPATDGIAPVEQVEKK